MPWIVPVPGTPIDGQFPKDFLARWQQLALTTNQADPVCCAPAWQLAFHEVFTPKRRVFYASTHLGAIILGEFIGQNGNTYLLPLEDSWLFGQPLLGEEAPLLLAEVMPELMEGNLGKIPDIIVSGIIEPSFFARALFQRFYPAFTFYRQDGCAGASASLRGGVDGWLGRRSANHRAKLRRSARHAANLGVSFERCRPTQENADSIYERIIAVERKSWKGIQHCGMAESPSLEFYRALLSRHAKNGAALVIFAMLENTDIGFIFGGICGNIYRGQQFSYANEYAKLSLGNLLQLQKIIWLCELGVERYDMGPVTGERMQYKEHWTEQFTWFNTWIMRRH